MIISDPMAAKLTIAIFLSITAARAQKQYCTTLVDNIIAYNEYAGGQISEKTNSRLQRICEKAITCNEEGCHGPFVRDERQCAACSSIIIPFLDGELKFARHGTEIMGGGLGAFFDKHGIKLHLPQPADCQKFGKGYCEWQTKLQGCADENEDGKVPRRECSISDPCKGVKTEGCDSKFRTINGKPVDVPSQRPWLSSLFFKMGGRDVGMCGGAWISETVIVTARHCVKEFVTGHAGRASNEWTDMPEQTVEFTRDDVRHYPHGDVDISVIKLRNVPHSGLPKVKPIDLPPRSTRVREGVRVKVAGWGIQCSDPPRCTQQHPANQHQLAEEVHIPVVEVDRQRHEFKAGGIDEHGYPRDTCSGDSGSPVVCGLEGGGSPYICGVVSRGPPPPRCGFAPGTYVDVTSPKVRAFLQSMIGATAKRGAADDSSNTEDDGQLAEDLLS